MPYKNIEDRRASYRKWYHTHKNNPVIKGKKTARDKARTAVPPEKCSIIGCDLLGERHHKDYSNPIDVIFLCKQHHELIHSNPSPCSICGEKQRALGLCFNHWRQQHRRIHGRK